MNHRPDQAYLAHIAICWGDVPSELVPMRRGLIPWWWKKPLPSRLSMINRQIERPIPSPDFVVKRGSKMRPASIQALSL